LFLFAPTARAFADLTAAFCSYLLHKWHECIEIFCRVKGRGGCGWAGAGLDDSWRGQTHRTAPRRTALQRMYREHGCEYPYLLTIYISSCARENEMNKCTRYWRCSKFRVRSRYGLEVFVRYMRRSGRLLRCPVQHYCTSLDRRRYFIRINWQFINYWTIQGPLEIYFPVRPFIIIFSIVRAMENHRKNGKKQRRSRTWMASPFSCPKAVLLFGTLLRGRIMRNHTTTVLHYCPWAHFFHLSSVFLLVCLCFFLVEIFLNCITTI
jgi:hypothetical protein